MIKGVLFQESLYKEPFWMLVACCLVNMTRWQQAEPIFDHLKKTYPTMQELSSVPIQELQKILQPLGLYKRRAMSLHRMAMFYMEGPPTTAEEVLDLPGCGKYASDSWAIFVEGRRDINPTDVELLKWLENNKVT